MMSPSLSRSRNTALLIVAATALLSSSAHAIGPAQVAPSGRGGVTPARARCSGCAEADSIRRNREKLLLRLDSLRSEIENRRMTDEERRLVAVELNETFRLLERALDESRHFEATVVARAQSQSPSRVQAQAIAGGFGGGGRARIPNPTTGYIGVTFEGYSAESRTPTDYSVRFYNYPRVTLVEASSPAERAGVMQGDTVIALNGTDVTREVISFTKLLVPDARVTMRVRRDGDSKELKLTVAEAPDYYARRREPVIARVAPGQNVGVAPRPQRVEVYGVPSGQGGAVTTPGAAPRVFFWTDYDGLAGASVETVSEGWAKALNVESGVMVVRVRPGTPAYRSELRDADVIIRAAGEKVQTVNGLRRLLAEGNGEDGVKLVIVRQGKQREVTLRWER